MTNEELCTAAQDGDSTALLLLWKQMRRLLYQRFFKQAGHVLRLYGMDSDDVEQLSFLALLWLVDHYDPDKGIMVSTYVTNACWQTIRSELGWRATNPKYRPPAVGSLNVRAETDGGEGAELGDLLPDPAAADAYQAIEAIPPQTVRATLDELPEKEAYVIRSRYWCGQTLQTIGTTMDLSRERVRQIEAKALDAIKQHIIEKEGDQTDD